MEQNKVLALFELANIKVKKWFKIANCYNDSYPGAPPWWLVRLEEHEGLIRLGWRKRVIEIDWSDTKIRDVVTKDEVTKDETMVHAWTYAKAVEYLSRVGYLLDIEKTKREAKEKEKEKEKEEEEEEANATPA